ncbi:MAG: hypothetical protein R3C97_19310 [Geminicoccaceae bacterium]
MSLPPISPDHGASAWVRPRSSPRLQLVTGHGQIVKTGGRVVKNVTGYDLCKPLTGSMGTFAVMSHLTFKVLPAPETCVERCS